MKQTIISFGLICFAVLVLFQLARFSTLQSDWSIQIWIAAISIIFLFIGVFLSKKFQKEKVTEKQVVIEKEVFITRDEFIPDLDKAKQLKISKREYEILQLINKGLSNQQIAEMLFLSEHTVKKHISNLFLKLDVERRTEAIRKGKELRLVD